MSSGILQGGALGDEYIARCDSGCHDFLTVVPDPDYKGAYYFCMTYRYERSLLDRIRGFFSKNNQIWEALLSPEDIKRLQKYLNDRMGVDKFI